MKKLLCIVFGISLVFACQKDQPEPENPFGTSSAGKDTSNTNLNPVSIAGLHKNIFSVRCSNPNCHDGTFEPDFRTVQSSYSTLVYKANKKNTSDSAFSYRVIPYDTSKSWLHERLTTKGNDYMPSNGVRLSSAEIGQINTWILNGAKDISGNVMAEPDNLPLVQYYAAFYPPQTRIDTIRQNNNDWSAPFYANKNTTILIWQIAEDDKTAVENYTINQMKCSLSKDGFGSAKTYSGYKFWEFQINTGDFAAGQVVYFRYYVSDGKHGSIATEFPNQSSESYFKTHNSFYIVP
jgi:hypothetical protein